MSSRFPRKLLCSARLALIPLFKIVRIGQRKFTKYYVRWAVEPSGMSSLSTEGWRPA